MPYLGDMPTSPDLIGAAEAAEILGNVDRTTVTRLAGTPDLPIAVKMPGIRGPYLFERADVERLAEKRAAKAAS